MSANVWQKTWQPKTQARCWMNKRTKCAKQTYWQPEFVRLSLTNASWRSVEWIPPPRPLDWIIDTSHLIFFPQELFPENLTEMSIKGPVLQETKPSWIRPLMGSILDWDSSSIQVSKVGNTDDLVGNERKWVGYLLQGRLKTGELVDVRPVGKSCGQVENVVSARQQPQICESLVRFVHVISLFNCACCTNADHLLNSPPC